MAEELQLKLLGNLEIHLAGVPLTGFTSNKVRALLCYLAVTGRPYLRPALAGLLWGELPETSAQNSLRKALTNLRQLVGPHLSISREAVAFDRDSAYWLDVEAFEARAGSTAGEGGIEPLQEAVALYRGDFLEGFYLREAPDFEEWALAQRARLRELALQALYSLAVHHSRRGKAGRAAAIDYTTHLLALEPWREEAHRQLMLLLAASDQRSAALAQYETCRRVLVEELGVEPSAEIREIYELLLKGEDLPGSLLTPIAWEREPRLVGECPYRGLAAFREEDVPVFFGREGFVGRLAEVVQRRPMVGIVGSSGSGKSSAVFAGLLPRLRNEGDWLVADFRPGAQPFRALAGALLPVLSSHLSDTDRLFETRKWAEAFAAGEAALSDATELVLQKQTQAQRLLLVVDQFEELYTLCPEPEVRRHFVDTLLAAVDAAGQHSEPRLLLLLAMRADFMGQALAYRPLADALQEASLLLGPMNRDELRAAIEQPAEVQGAAFEAGLVERILDDVGEEPGSLPLLEFALTLLWERHSHGWLTHAGYEEIGRVEGALARYAGEVYGKLAEAEQAAARQVFVQLVRPGEGTEDTRRLATRAEVGDEHWALVQHLAGRRLVVTGRDAAGGETVEVVHEALIQGWGQLHAWLQTDRAFRTWQEWLRAALRQWVASREDEGALMRGAPLAESENWLAARPGELSQAEKEFIQAGAALREAQRQRELEATRRLAAQVQLATSRELAAAAVANVHVDPERSVLLALEALSKADTLEAQNALRQALPELRMRHSTVAHDSTVYAVAFSPDGTLLATSSHDTTAKIWNASTSQLLFTLETTGNVFDVDFSPDGKLLATSGITDLIVWDPATGQQVLTLSGESIGTTEGYELGVGRIAFRPDGKHLAAANQGGVPKVWELATRKPVLSLAGHTKICKAIAYSPDGMILATGGDDGMVRVWDAQSGQELRLLEGHSAYIWAVAFSPDGARLVSVDDAGILRIWDVASGKRMLSLTNPSAGAFRSTLFLPDGSGVVTTGYDGTTRIWDAATGRQRLLLAGHTSTVLDAAISLDGCTLVTGSVDGTIKTWDLAPGREVYTLDVRPGAAGRVAYSPDGRHLAAAASDGKIRIWDRSTSELVAALSTDQPHPWQGGLAYSLDGAYLAAGAGDGVWALWNLGCGRTLATVAGHASIIQGLAISPDGMRLATSSFDGTAKVWDVSTLLHSGRSPAEVVTFTGHVQPATTSNWVFDVAFSPGGQFVASAGSDATVRVWNAATGQERLTLPGGEGAVLMTAVAYSPDGTLIAGGQFSGPIRLWETNTGKLVHVLSGHSAGVVDLAFSPDGKLLASASFDLLAKVWDVQSGQEAASLHGNAGRVMGVTFSPDGTQVATGGEDGTVRIYAVSVEDLVALARSRLTRSLTTEECQKYLHVDERP